MNNQNYIYSWINNNTAENDIILAERNIERGINQKIRLLSKRAVVVDYEFPFLQKHYLEWYNRFIDIYKSPNQSNGYVDSLTNDELFFLSNKYSIDKIIRTNELSSDERFKLIKILNNTSPKKVYVYSTK